MGKNTQERRQSVAAAIARSERSRLAPQVPPATPRVDSPANLHVAKVRWANTRKSPEHQGILAKTDLRTILSEALQVAVGHSPLATVPSIKDAQAPLVVPPDEDR